MIFPSTVSVSVISTVLLSCIILSCISPNIHSVSFFSQQPQQQKQPSHESFASLSSSQRMLNLEYAAPANSSILNDTTTPITNTDTYNIHLLFNTTTSTPHENPSNSSSPPLTENTAIEVIGILLMSLAFMSLFCHALGDNGIPKLDHFCMKTPCCRRRRELHEVRQRRHAEDQQRRQDMETRLQRQFNVVSYESANPSHGDNDPWGSFRSIHSSLQTSVVVDGNTIGGISPSSVTPPPSFRNEALLHPTVLAWMNMNSLRFQSTTTSGMTTISPATFTVEQQQRVVEFSAEERRKILDSILDCQPYQVNHETTRQSTTPTECITRCSINHNVPANHNDLQQPSSQEANDDEKEKHCTTKNNDNDEEAQTDLPSSNSHCHEKSPDVDESFKNQINHDDYDQKMDSSNFKPTTSPLTKTNQGDVATSLYQQHNHEEENYNDAVCAICLEEFETGVLVVNQSQICRHVFHKECLFLWLQHHNECPCCRTILFTKCQLEDAVKQMMLQPTSTAITMEESSTIVDDVVTTTSDREEADIRVTTTIENTAPSTTTSIEMATMEERI